MPLMTRSALSVPSAPLALCQAGGLLRALGLTLGASVLAVLALADNSAPLDALAANSFALMRILVGTVLWWLGLSASQRLWRGWTPVLRWLLLLGWGVALAAFIEALAQPLELTLSAPNRSWPSVVMPLLLAAVWASLLWAWQDSALRRQPPLDAQRRLDELQARIRPHFLFNTLNSALALVTVDPPRAERVLENLSDLIRATLDQDGTEVTLGHELALGRQYLDIEALRFGDQRLRVVWSIDDSVLTARLPALTLQPLLENAVHHGIEPAPQGGDIVVLVRRTLGSAEILITNTRPAPSGPSHAPAMPRPGRGMALDNVRQRLHLMHDLAAELVTHDNAQHFEVRLVLPLSA